jgi:nitroreductase
MRTKAPWRGPAAATLAAAGAISYRAHRQGLLRSQDPSLEAWTEFDTHRHAGAHRLVAAAVLAASPHNSQPWRFSVSDREVLLGADFGRKLGAMDPFEREIFIGLGCALENMVIAAPGAALAADVALPPDSRRDWVARIALSPADGSPHRLERAIARRRTDRGPYDKTRQIDAETIGALQREVGAGEFDVVFFSRVSPEAVSFSALTVEATQDIIADRDMSRDSARWYRQNQAEIDASRDGLTIQTQGLPPWLATLTRLGPSPSERAAHAIWLKNTRDVQLATAAQIGMILVPEARLLDDALSLRVGRAWQRFHLAATLLGIACQPMNQIPERISRERQLGSAPKMQRALEQRLPLDGRVPTFCFRMGIPTRGAPHSPRRTVAMMVEPSPSRPL